MLYLKRFPLSCIQNYTSFNWFSSKVSNIIYIVSMHSCYSVIGLILLSFLSIEFAVECGWIERKKKKHFSIINRFVVVTRFDYYDLTFLLRIIYFVPCLRSNSFGWKMSKSDLWEISVPNDSNVDEQIILFDGCFFCTLVILVNPLLFLCVVNCKNYSITYTHIYHYYIQIKKRPEALNFPF